MKKYTCLSICLLTNMLLADVVVQDIDSVMAELNILADNDSSDGLTRSHKPKCDACPPKDNGCTRLQCREIITKVCDIDTKVDNVIVIDNEILTKVCILSMCEPIPISITVLPIIIDQPGSYCVTNDNAANGDITIASDDVFLDLNNHVARSVTISGRKNVHVVNGTLDGSSILGGMGLISVVNLAAGCNNIHLSDLAVLNGGVSGSQFFNQFIGGINITTSTNVFISNCLSQANTNQGCNINTSCDGVYLTNCTFQDSFLAGLVISSSKNIISRECAIIENGFGSPSPAADGIQVTNGSTQVFFFDCISNGNGESGFRGDNSASQYAFIGCYAENNGWYGFRTEPQNVFYFEDCTARFNGGNSTSLDGFSFNPLFDSGTPGEVNHCVSVQNARSGFDIVSVSDTDADILSCVSNYAANNDNPMAQYTKQNGTVNLDPLPTTPPFYVVGANDVCTQYWRNVRTNVRTGCGN